MVSTLQALRPAPEYLPTWSLCEHRLERPALSCSPHRDQGTPVRVCSAFSRVKHDICRNPAASDNASVGSIEVRIVLAERTPKAPTHRIMKLSGTKALESPSVGHGHVLCVKLGYILRGSALIGLF